MEEARSLTANRMRGRLSSLPIGPRVDPGKGASGATGRGLVGGEKGGEADLGVGTEQGS